MKKRIPVIASILIVMALLIAMATPVYAWGWAKSESESDSDWYYYDAWADVQGDGDDKVGAASDTETTYGGTTYYDHDHDGIGGPPPSIEAMALVNAAASFVDPSRAAPNHSG